jgi:hypothetical protein
VEGLPVVGKSSTEPVKNAFFSHFLSVGLDDGHILNCSWKLSFSRRYLAVLGQYPYQKPPFFEVLANTSPLSSIAQFFMLQNLKKQLT